MKTPLAPIALLLLACSLGCDDKTEPDAKKTGADSKSKEAPSDAPDAPDQKRKPDPKGVGAALGLDGGGGPKAAIRFVNAFAPGGQKKAIAVHARTGKIEPVLESLAYGEASDYIDVRASSVGETALWVTDAGQASDGKSGKMLARIDKDKRYTLVIYDGFKRVDPQPADVADQTMHVLMDQASDRNKAAAGKAALWIPDSVMQSIREQHKWGVVGRGCLPTGDIHQVDPGKLEPALFDLSAANSACAGTPLAKAEATDLAAGKSYAVIPIGETKAELTVKLFPAD